VSELDDTHTPGLSRAPGLLVPYVFGAQETVCSECLSPTTLQTDNCLFASGHS
jgi:hypothetical protein